MPPAEAGRALEALRSGRARFPGPPRPRLGLFARLHRLAGPGRREGPGRHRAPGQAPLGLGQGDHAPRIPHGRPRDPPHGHPARFAAEPEVALTPELLAPLGVPFVVKPANTTGGSVGVVADASGPADVLAARRTYPADKYLLQEKVVPETRDGRRFWFRGFYVLGEVHLTWWDDRTHLYAELGPDEAAPLGLDPIYAVVRTIARVSRLRFFSTEVARDAGGRIVVVDYVNDICDMRLRSVHPDGVPDAVVARIADRIAAHAGAAAARDRSD